MRKELIHELIKEIQGPRTGSEENVDYNPWEEYITGVLIPQSIKDFAECEKDPDSEILRTDEGPLNEDDFTDFEISPNIPSELDPKMRPKSFGISFIVNNNNPSFEICITWGRYFENADKKTSSWIRRPYCYENSDLKYVDEKPVKIYDEKDGEIDLYIKKIPWKENYHITLFLVNNLKNDGKCRPSIPSCIFQPSIRVNLKDNTSIVNPDYSSKSDEELSFIYRGKPVRARGHMCSVLWKEIDYAYKELFDMTSLWPDGGFFGEKCENYFYPDLRSDFMPLYPMPAPEYDWDKELDTEPRLSACELSNIWTSEEISQSLDPLIIEYNTWIDSNTRKLKENGEKTPISDAIIKKQHNTLERIEKGVEILKNDENARLAFCFANRTIHQQYEWEKKFKDKDEEKIFEWRPFQIAFFLINIESICDESSSYRDVLDLLWIPTGGGKTEAYLGITAFTMCLRRMKALSGLTKEKSGAGTSIISRYTLRILTIQQFRRTLRMVTAAEYLRVLKCEGKIGWRPKKCELSQNWLYGSTRFSVGMWVGGAVSPNHLRTKNENIGAIDALMGIKGARGEPAQVINCPVCDNFLAIPSTGIPKGKNQLHIVAKKTSNSEFPEKIEYLKNHVEYVTEIQITERNHEEGFITVSLELSADKELKISDIMDIWNQIKEKLGIYEVSLSLARPGYFGSARESGRRTKNFSQFEIWCTNPECALNTDILWKEGVPGVDSIHEIFPDGLMRKNFISPFLKDSRIPIPAYTVDEQVYNQCPTIIISTADKIARLAFEPNVSAIFGAVDRYNPCYGFHRKHLFPKGPAPTPTKKCESQDIEIKPLNPPELILQDELHLIDGPLGSMFGLYEAIVEAIIKERGGKPKYIASTATIKNANTQVLRLFGKDLFQFPPYGISIDDSFFVREIPFKNSWGNKQRGRIYMGVYSPGLGPLYPLVKMWARLIKVPFDLMDKKDYEDELKYFWTIVGYYNAIKELGSGIAIYREDIPQRLNVISEEDPQREIDQEKKVDLSSREDSTKIPILLSELERDGDLNPGEKHPFYDAIFTTSMFGTGVDISHLSTMIVHGQPKTTGSYIQATGRIGRSYGGLVITFLRSGRPRDLSHYEMFTSYHHRIHLGVEPVSVSPFSRGALWKGAGASCVSYLRNKSKQSANWFENNGKLINSEFADSDIQEFYANIKERLNVIYKDNTDKQESILTTFKAEIEKWKKTADRIDKLDFFEYPYFLPRENVVLGDPAHEHYEKVIVYQNAPTSLRDIEETTGFQVK